MGSGETARVKSESQDRADVERVFSIYLRSLEAADVELASQVWLQSPDVLVVSPIGRFNGWEGVKEIWERTRTEFSVRKVQTSNVTIVVAGDAAWLVFDFVFTGTRADGKPPVVLTGWESHGYQRTADGWRLAHLHYSVPMASPAGRV